MASSDLINEVVARSLVQQIDDLVAVACPLCRTPVEKDQDTPGRLMCPRCKMGFDITVDGWPHHYQGHSTDWWLDKIMEGIK